MYININYLLLEWFSIECHKTKAKVIAQGNHKGQIRLSKEPINIQNKDMWQTVTKCELITMVNSLQTCLIEEISHWFWLYL